MELVFLAPKWLSTQEPLHFRRKFELVVVSLQLPASVILGSRAVGEWEGKKHSSCRPKKKKKKAAIATGCCRGCQAFIASSIAGGAIMHSSTNGFPLRSHFVYWLHWKVIPKQPGINHRRLAEMPLLLSPSGQYTVCRYGGHTVRVLSFFFFFFLVFAFCWYCMF